MRLVLVTCLLVVWPGFALAQGNETVQRSSSPSGLKIRDSGPTTGRGETLNNNAEPSSGERNSSTTTATSSQQTGGKSSIQIQGNTKIKAQARNLNSVSTGINSAAGNEVGAIGK